MKRKTIILPILVTLFGLTGQVCSGQSETGAQTPAERAQKEAEQIRNVRDILRQYHQSNGANAEFVQAAFDRLTTSPAVRRIPHFEAAAQPLGTMVNALREATGANIVLDDTSAKMMIPALKANDVTAETVLQAVHVPVPAVAVTVVGSLGDDAMLVLSTVPGMVHPEPDVALNRALRERDL